MFSKTILSTGEHRKKLPGIILTVMFAWLSAVIVLQNYLIAMGLFSIFAFVIGMFFVLRRYSGNIFTNVQLLLIFTPLVFLYVTGIPKIGPFPLSPLFFFIGIYVLLGSLRLNLMLHSLRESGGKIFLLLVACWSYDYIFSRVYLQLPFLDMQLLEIIGIYLATKYFIGYNAQRAAWATRVLSIVFLVSMLWFVSESLFKELSEVRITIYQSYLQKVNDHTLLGTASYANGLSPLLFLFGYQIAASLPLNVVAIFFEKNRAWKMFYVVGSVASLFAMIFAGERSVLIATTVSISIFLYKRKGVKLAAVLMLLSLTTMFMVSMHESKRHTFERLWQKEERIEAVERLKLQMIGVITIVNNPMGLAYEGKRWSDEAASYGVDFRKFNNEEIAVHNSYLGRIIYYGWPFGFLIICVMFILVKNIIAVLSFSLYEKDSQAISQAQIIAYALISVLIQALFHNASIFTFNGPSVTVMFLFLSWADLISSERSSKKRISK